MATYLLPTDAVKKTTTKKRTTAKEKAPGASQLVSKVLKVCGTIADIAGAAQGVSWVYQHAWPLVESIWQEGLFCPESFWWDSLALPMRRGESPAQIQSHLAEALARLRADRERIEERLTHYSESDRQRISDAYDKVSATVHTQYPLAAQLER